MSQIFGRDFIKTRISARGVGGGMLELDGYCKSLNLAVEHNGLQHYEPLQFGNMTMQEARQRFKTQSENDKVKAEWCKKNKVSLIVIRQLGTHTPLEKLKEEIRRQALEEKVHIPARYNDIELVFNEKIMKPEAIKKWQQMHDMANQAGYDIITDTYTGTHARYLVKCHREGHETPKVGRKILMGRVCVDCLELDRCKQVIVETVKTKRKTTYPSVSAASRALGISLPEAWWSVHSGTPRNGRKLYLKP
jgi:hypothetical protein